MAMSTHIWIFFNLHIYKKIRVRKYPNQIVLVRPHLPDMYPDKSTLFSTEHAHYQETWACNKYKRHLCLLIWSFNTCRSEV